MRERIRNILRTCMGRRKYDNLMEKIKRKIMRSRKIIKEKYQEKTQ